MLYNTVTAFHPHVLEWYNDKSNDWNQARSQIAQYRDTTP